MLNAYPLNIRQIQAKLKQNLLPKDYTLCSQHISINDLLTTLSLFNDDDQLLHFINTVSKNNRIQILVNNRSFKMGSITNFIAAYTQYNLFPTQLSAHKQNLILEHFKKNIYLKQQVAYLLKEVGNTRHQTLLTHCCDKNLLLELANDQNLVFDFESGINRTLYHFLNPAQKAISEMPLLEMFNWTTRAGHALGLNGHIDVQVKNKTCSISPRAEFTQNSLKLLIEALESYSQKFIDNETSAILKSFKACHDLMKKAPASSLYKDDAHLTFYQRYQNNELTFLAHEWVGHCIGVAFLGKYMIYTNRGIAGDLQFGSKIYEIKDVSKVNETFFKQLTQTPDSAQETLKILNQIVDLNIPLVKFRSKAQKHSNCSMANPKASMEGMNVLTQASANALPSEIIAISQQEYKRSKYKRITAFIRRREIEVLLQNMRDTTHPDLIQFFATLTSNIIKEHHGKNKGYIKNDLEVRQASRLFNEAPEKVKEILKKDQQLMQIIKDVEEQIQKLKPQNTSYTTYYRNNNTVKNQPTFVYLPKNRPSN
ncbi:MAG: hypothetical protein JSS07_08135 [Proteobacteria bacterium]|nr:hypothetical protein [Pseudomonadota bacterium]